MEKGGWGVERTGGDNNTNRKKRRASGKTEYKEDKAKYVLFCLLPET